MAWYAELIRKRWYGERCNGMSDGIEIAIEMLKEIIKE